MTRKTFFHSLPMMMSAMMMAACSNEDVAGLTGNDNTQQSRTWQVSINAGPATTRAISVGGNNGQTLYTNWDANDAVEVVKDGASVGTLNADVSKGNSAYATLTGTLTGTFSVDDEVTLCYHTAALDYTGQVGTLAGVSTNKSYLTASSTVKSVDGIGGFLSMSDAAFSPMQAYLDLSFTDGTNPLSIISLDIWADGGKLVKTKALDGTTTYATEEEPLTITPASPTDKFFIALRDENDAANNYHFKATLEGNKVFVYEGSKDLKWGKFYAGTVTMTEHYIDLSMVDCAGNARATMWTANCYMVHKAGGYKLPLVYGNAIKNGATNAAAYTGVSGQLETFTNHAGTAITDPWIKNNGITVNSAELLWQDANGLITKVGIEGDYLTLTVSKDATTQEGNAVIAVKSGSDIVWSWHIWVTKQTFATLTTIATGSHNYQVTPVNLGWVATGGEGKQGYAPFYQWGRKDAFIPGTGTANTNHTVYNISGTAVTGFTFKEDNNATIADNIQNPTTYYSTGTYSSGGNFGPCNTTYYNMWDAQNTAEDNVTTATVKTVYDPSPAGFCVPTGNLFYFMGNGSSSRPMTTSWDDTYKGATWSNSVVASSITGDNLYFPASGCRNYGSGTLYNVGSGGFCWSASPGSSYVGRSLDFNSGYWYWGYSTRATGTPVRAVAEE